ncbi:MAG: hypothetical protein R2765_11725 [Ferruginibacter sp.]|nr:hypothetical protein [Bacteroidota bacterium]MBX2917833.1 hypothetical protein [Ferruginibacter sp.]MCB0708681.1 hypothetical protein [Chitinophagaceae bacterium]MCC7380074.1 hypothetical protein [Chitinophagaceae bacterium]
MSEVKLTENESLKLITEMIGKAKGSYHSNGTSAILWGLVIFFCSIFEFFEMQFNFDIGFNIWWLMFVALVPQFYLMLKSSSKKNFESYEEKTMSFVWWAFAASVVMMMFFNSYYRPSHSESLFLMLFGMPTFITGGMFRFKPMIIGGITCWILFVVSIYTSLKINLLLMALAALSAWLVPGIILHKKCIREAQQ